MKPLVSIIMGSTSDLPVMEKACKWLNDFSNLDAFNFFLLLNCSG